MGDHCGRDMDMEGADKKIRTDNKVTWTQLHKGQGKVNFYDKEELYRNTSHLLSSKDALQVEIFTLNGNSHCR